MTRFNFTYRIGDDDKDFDSQETVELISQSKPASIFMVFSCQPGVSICYFFGLFETSSNPVGNDVFRFNFEFEVYKDDILAYQKTGTISNIAKIF
jgi:hypothetical protein